MAIKRNDNAWEYKFDLLLEFIKEFKRLPKNKESYKGENIGPWLYNQKASFKRGKLFEDRQIKLESIGIDFYDWESRFNLLKDFVEYFERLPNPEDVYKKVEIGAWLKIKNNAFCNNILLKEEQMKLESLGVIFDTWDYKCNLLEEFVEEFGRLPKLKDIYKGEKIGYWVRGQKISYTKETLSEEKKQKLEALGIVFKEKEERTTVAVQQQTEKVSITKKLFSIIANFF